MNQNALSTFRQYVWLSVALISAAVISASGQQAREIASKTFPSVVLIVMEDENGQPLSLGSGFFVSPNRIASNFHVVEGASAGYAKLIGKKQKYAIKGLAGVDEFNDLALIVVEDANATPLPIGESQKMEVGDEVFAVGNPQGLEGTFSQGIVSSVRTFGTNSLLQITAPISPGSSGGPVLNRAGEVVGVAVATFKGGQNLNFAVPAVHVRNLLKDASATNPLASITKRKANASALDALGGRSVEGVVGSQFAWSSEFDTEFKDGFTFSLRNMLREPVKNVYCLVIFYDRSGKPLDFVPVRENWTIPAGLATRSKREVDGSIKKLTTHYREGGAKIYNPIPETKLEIRVLNFEFAE